MNIVIPMAGAGSRFAEAGYPMPKPLVPVLGEPMYAWALRSLPLERARRLILICLQEHLDRYELEADIRARFGGRGFALEVLGLDHVTGGQAETVMTASRWIDDEEPLLVFNADTFIPVPFAPPEGLDGVIQTFGSDDPRYSYVRLDAEGLVVEVAEKRVISPHATTGLYMFSRGRDFVEFTKRFLDAGLRINGESYVMLTYEQMLLAGKRIGHVAAPAHWVLGTPQELERFERLYPQAPVPR